MTRRAIAWLLSTAMGLGGCAAMTGGTAGVPAYESAACGMTTQGPDGKPWFYPPGQREACLRILTALAQLEAQRRRGEFGELRFLTQAVALLNKPEATAVLAASTAPNGGWLGERKHAYEQALEAAQRTAGCTISATAFSGMVIGAAEPDDRTARCGAGRARPRRRTPEIVPVRTSASGWTRWVDDLPISGAEGGTRTPTGCPTRPSNVRVCQFRHFGASEQKVCRRAVPLSIRVRPR